MNPEVEKLLKDLESEPHHLVTCGDAAELIRAVLKVGDEQTARTIQVLIGIIAGALNRVVTDHQTMHASLEQRLADHVKASIDNLTLQVKGYVDGQVEVLNHAVAEAKQTTWN